MKSKKTISKPAPSGLGRPKDISKREDIVRAAGVLFMNKGYELTSMEAVAQKADVSKLTIYSHFADKDELFKEVIRLRCDKLAMPESYLALAKEPVEKGLLKLASNFTTLVFNPDSIRLHRIMQGEAQRHPRVIQIFYEAGPKRVKSAFADLLKAWVKQGQLSIPDVTRATQQFFSLLKGEMLSKIILCCATEPTKRELALHVRASVTFFLAAYQTKKTQKM